MIAQRLEVLRAEFNKGRQQLAVIERQRIEVRETLLRISGAIQVLEELRAENAITRGASE